MSMMAAISLQALFVPCSILLRPHIHLEALEEFLNHAANIFVAVQQKRPSLETFPHFFCRISRGRFECRDSFPHYIRCPERGNSFSPFLRKRGRRGGEGPSKGKGPLHNLGRGLQKSLPFFFCSSLTLSASVFQMPQGGRWLPLSIFVFVCLPLYGVCITNCIFIS